jgi:phosphohistidine phosphatase
MRRTSKGRFHNIAEFPNAGGHGFKPAVGNWTAYESDLSDMLRLMLLRHGKSSWPSGLQDIERPLSERGEAAARLMGGYLAHHGLAPADRVLCSPARRTRDTWAGVWAGISAATSTPLPAATDIVFDGRLYGATRQGILSVIQDQGDSVHTLLLIGHNPGLQEAAEWLIAAGDVELREQLHEKFPTAGLAVIDFALDRWSRVHARSGRLDRFVTPRLIAAATDEGPVR